MIFQIPPSGWPVSTNCSLTEYRRDPSVKRFAVDFSRQLRHLLDKDMPQNASVSRSMVVDVAGLGTDDNLGILFSRHHDEVLPCVVLHGLYSPGKPQHPASMTQFDCGRSEGKCFALHFGTCQGEVEGQSGESVTRRMFRKRTARSSCCQRPTTWRVM